MKKIFATSLGFGIALASASASLAAGTATIETGFSSIATDLTTLLGGAGGVLLTVIALIVALWAWVSGKGLVPVVSAFGVAFGVSYGLPMLSGISGATATTALLGF